MKIYRISSALRSRLEWVPINDLIFFFGNEKPNVVEDIMRSLKKNGWDKNEPAFVYDRNGSYILMNGHHRLAAAYRIGMEKAYCLIVDSDEAWKIESLTDEITEVEDMARKEVGLN